MFALQVVIHTFIVHSEPPRLPPSLVPHSLAAAGSTHAFQRTSSPSNRIVVLEIAAACGFSQRAIGVAVNAQTSSIALGADGLARTLVTWLERGGVVGRGLCGR
jgi:hypothetical protein